MGVARYTFHHLVRRVEAEACLPVLPGSHGTGAGHAPTAAADAAGRPHAAWTARGFPAAARQIPDRNGGATAFVKPVR